MNILYFVVGNSPIVHLQVMFSLRTFAAQLSKEDRIIVMTETPMLYSCDECHCKVEIIPLSEQQIKEWRTIDYNGKNGDYICKFFTCSYMTMRSFADELDVIRHINMRTVNGFLKVKRIIRKHIFGKKS